MFIDVYENEMKKRQASVAVPESGKEKERKEQPGNKPSNKYRIWCVGIIIWSR